MTVPHAPTNFVVYRDYPDRSPKSFPDVVPETITEIVNERKMS
jgi:hypothetical protein